jgi:hypothetical protein
LATLINNFKKKMLPIEIISTGIYVPCEAISNEELKKLAQIEFDAKKQSKNWELSTGTLPICAT